MPIHLDTPRLLLRPWQEDDAESLYRYARDPAVGPIAGWPPHTSVENSREIIRTVFAAPETYALVLRATGEPIGCAGIMPVDRANSTIISGGEAEIGYWLGVPYWGRGLTTEAVHCLLHRCFTSLDMSAVWCIYFDGNHRSRRVMEKCGFTFHHTETEKPTLLGDLRTEHFMRLTREAWRQSTCISLIPHHKKQFLPLLLLADEEENMIDRYLERGELYIMSDAEGRPLAVSVVTDEGNGIAELKNLAVVPSHRRKGYGRRMVEQLCRLYRNRFHTLLAGTGDSRQTVGFYESCGFFYSHSVPDFFTLNYTHPIVEEGRVLRDMLYFRKNLSPAD